MARSTVTWRLGFSSVPKDDLLIRAKELLAPISRIERPPDYGPIFREHGLSDHLFVEPEAERDAGEIALSCLTKAHRLGRGWAVMWPGFTPAPQGGYPAGEVDRARSAQTFNGLNGSFSASTGDTALEGLVDASFTVVVAAAEAVQRPAAQAAPPRPPAELAPPATGLVANAMVTDLVTLLASHRTTAWVWDAAGVRRQIVGLGYLLAGREPGGERFTARGRPALRLMTEGARVRWIEFILLEHPHPHLLDETAFDRRQREFEALFSAAVHAARPLLGQPVFAGASGEHGFPQDQWADFAALWQDPHGRILIEQKHNDRELPLELCLVFAP
jgi:hypothetical protein